jgi:predicted acylesterase/phospholipase RssA
MTEKDDLSPNDSPKKIRHIVLSGGGGTGFAYYGALRESHADGFWNIDDIQTMHGVSCGALFTFMMALLKQIGWTDYDDYCIKRPWETVFGFSPDRILKAYSNIGICDRETVKTVISPILRAVDLSLNVTMQEFYDFTGIEVHFYTTSLDTYKLVDISYKTHPDWEIVDAIYSSCALPLLFRPNQINGEVYMDGGLLCNYPLQQCIAQATDPDEIFGMNKIGLTSSKSDVSMDSFCGDYDRDESSPKKDKTKEYTNIIDYLLDIIAKTAKQLMFETATSKYTMEIPDTITSVWEVYEVIKTKESRAAKIQYGVELWKDFRVKIGFKYG